MSTPNKHVNFALHECHDVWNNYNSIFGLPSKKTSKLVIPNSLWGESTADRSIPPQSVSMSSWDDAVKWTRRLRVIMIRYIVGLLHTMVALIRQESKTELQRHFRTTFSNQFLLFDICSILIRISLKSVLNGGPINNVSEWVQILSWCPTGDKSLSKATVANLRTYICGTRPRWVKRKCKSHL